MKKRFSFILVLSFFLFLILPIQAQAIAVYIDDLTLSSNCNEVSPEDYYWELNWEDNLPTRADDGTTFTESYYKLEAPCKVFNGDTFEVRITATDNVCNDYSFTATIADVWSLTDEVVGPPPIFTTVDSGSYYGGNDISVHPTGVWQKSYMLSTPGPFDHEIIFSAKDLGHCGGGHSWTTFVSGDVVVDPERGSDAEAPANSAPSATAGDDITITSQEQSATVINGSASDADDDELEYRWLDSGAVVQAYESVGFGGDASLDLSTLSTLSLGAHRLTLEVTDSEDSAVDSMVLTILNSPPTASPNGDGAVYNLNERLALSATVSDFDGDTLTYLWLDNGSALASGEVATRSGFPTRLPITFINGGLALGVHTMTLQVFDGTDTASASIEIEYVDTVPPTLAPTANPSELFPPNNDMHSVTVTSNAADNSGEQPFISASVTSNGGDASDYSIESIDQDTGTVELLLKAASDKGRAYTIVVEAQDASGNTASAAVTVGIKHDRRSSGKGLKKGHKK